MLSNLQLNTQPVVGNAASGPPVFIKLSICASRKERVASPSPERINDGSCGHKRDFALLHPLAHGGEVSPTTPLLQVIDNNSFSFINLRQDETQLSGRGRGVIHLA